MKRIDGRTPAQMRKVNIQRDYMRYAEGSALIEVGNTRVLCAATIEDKVPHFLRGSGEGWITAEYALLPRSTQVRNVRESAKGKVTGRTHEIQRLIGRALRSVVNLKALGERTVWIDCDVLQADGGTRCAAITGAWVALHDACESLVRSGKLAANPLTDHIAAVSVGIYNGTPVLDLDYPEDSACDTDMNVIMTGSGGLVEVQGTAEGAPFSRNEMNTLLDLAQLGIRQLIAAQEQALAA